MPDLLKYAVVERERRFLLRSLPGGPTSTSQITDRYVEGTRLRLREVAAADGTVTRKLGHKVRLGTGPEEVACTSLYLDRGEWDLLGTLPARTLRKTRHLYERDGLVVAVDVLEDGTLLAEIDDRDHAPVPVPDWLEVLEDVSTLERWTGAALAR